MAKLVWQPTGQAAIAFSLQHERVAVGRDPGNDVRLMDLAVSAQHAVIITRAGPSIVHDLNSSNGTWVNGKRIEASTLRHGDSVCFGRVLMHFLHDEKDADAVVEKATAQLSGTLVIDSGSPAVPVPVLTTGADHPGVDELDRLLGSIRRFRDDEQAQAESRRQRLLDEWRKVVQYGHALKEKLASEPRVKYFEVSERRNEIVVRIERGRDQPLRLLMLTCGHLELRTLAGEGIWMRETDSADRRFDNGQDALRDFVASIAHWLA